MSAVHMQHVFKGYSFCRAIFWTGEKPANITADWSQVTCKRCLRMRRQ